MKGKSSGTPWIVGGALLLNAAINMAWQGKDIKRTLDGRLPMGFWIESALIWAFSFVPYARYISMFLALPILFVNVVVKLPTLLENFNKDDSSGSGGSMSA